MTSSNVFIFLLLLFFIAIAESEKKKSIDKIIIHVPYKIHKHHHTHTKYKVITIPAPKHESTIIYLKENQQETKPEVQPQVQHLEESNFTPPHQQSAASLLQHLQNYKVKAEEPEEKHQLSQATTDQKSLETSNQNFVPTYEFQPMIIPTHENIIPQFSLKPVLLPEHQMYTPKYLINPTFHHQHNFIPNFDYQTATLLQPPPLQFIPKHSLTQTLPSKMLQDNVAHSTSHEYKMVMTRGPKSASYKVREEVQEDRKGQFNRQQHKTTKIIVPSLKSNRQGNTYIRSGEKYNRSIPKMIPVDPNYEYEHVGYLVVDGNSRKIVGKNFKDEIYLRR